ncbi:DUF4169 family protein [Woodsholea maritima]|uniref:DUF4169 family protein n=1 Tax=Woodsholea maritima TaxID=240237 RepID=UPI00036DBE2E|nr:DUF4169 family protein [Woodsholea maritima]
MTTDTINLRHFRKLKARKDKAKQAAQNRVIFGTPKALRDGEALRRTRAEAKLDQLRRETANDGPGDEDESEG